jgi:hypothetical protein
MAWNICLEKLLKTNLNLFAGNANYVLQWSFVNAGHLSVSLWGFPLFCSRIIVSKVVCGLRSCRTFFIVTTFRVFVGLFGVGCYLYSL